MQTEHTSANIELKPKRTTKGREQQRREKQRLETAESKKVPNSRKEVPMIELVRLGFEMQRQLGG